MADVFISYKRVERERCQRIEAKLRTLGLDVWFDAKIESGKDFDREIEQTIARAKAVIVLWSKESVKSDWVRNEARFGKNKGKLIAVRLDDCELPIEFQAVHFEELHDPLFPDDDPAWLRVLGRVAALTERPSIVSFSRALAAAAVPLEQWAKANPDDPLSARMQAHASLLGGQEPEAVAHALTKKRNNVGAIALSALLAALVAGAAGYAGGRLLTPPPPPQIVQATVAPTPSSVAAALSGRWRLSSETCQRPVEVWSRGDLLLMFDGELDNATGDRVDQILAQSIEGLENGWLVARGPDGAANRFRLNEGTLEARLGDAPFTMTFEACP